MKLGNLKGIILYFIFKILYRTLINWSQHFN